MMYSNRLVACIKVGGKVLRELSGVVSVPFGSEYAVYLKNLNSVRAVANVSIDGNDATDGRGLILGPSESLDLERFIRNGNLERGNRFKFIERTADIEQHRGVGAEDGLVRVEYRFERVVQEAPITRYHYYDEWWPRPKPWYPTITWESGTLLRSCCNSSVSANCVSLNDGHDLKVCETAVNTAGITVAGSESSQKFTTGSWFPTEANSTVIVLTLRGEVGGKPVQTAVTVDRKATCETCGKKSKAGAQFCASCGTALVLV